MIYLSKPLGFWYCVKIGVALGLGLHITTVLLDLMVILTTFVTRLVTQGNAGQLL